MRKKIWRMAEDHFDIAIPKLRFYEEQIELEAVAGEPFRSSFLIESTNTVSLRGVCYCSNPFIRILSPQFEGASVEIFFEAVGSHFRDGEAISGEFDIVTAGYEEKLPFIIHYKRSYPASSVGPIDSDEQFARLCREHWNEAMQLFFSDRIKPFIDSLPIERRLCYKGFSSGAPTSANLESYLVETGAKERAIFSIDESNRDYYGINENQRETIDITRSNWGNIEIRAKVDADFITLDQKFITADFFMGSHMQLSWYIHVNRLHAGKNFACISLESESCSQEIHIMATRDAQGEGFIPASRLSGKRLIELTNCYEEYRFEKISSQEWSGETVRILDQLIEDDGKNLMYHLMKAHALIVGRSKQEALWIIQQLRRDIEDRKTTEWAYLLYLCTLIEKEESYIERLVHEIELIYREQSDNPIIFWFLLFLREEYIDDYKRRITDIKRWMMDGENSPFYYVEACYLLRQEPFLLTYFDQFSIRILRWMIRHGQLTQALADQISYILEGERTFQKPVFDLARSAFDVYPTDAFLTNIVAYLLRSHQYGQEYLTWYDRAIRAEMRFTGLYEAYILSLPSDYGGMLPQMVVMYFRYQNTLPSEKKAFVYANVILHRKDQVRIYEQYIRHMEEFALDMARKGRIDDNLAIIYQHIFLDRGIIDDEIADQMGELLFYDKVFGLDSDIVRVYVYQEQLASPVVGAVENHKAYVPVYSRNYQVFLEDSKGHLTCDRGSYYTEHLMQPGRVYRRLYEMASSRLSYFLYDLNQRSSQDELYSVDIPDIEEFLLSDRVDLGYKQQMYPMLISYLNANGHRDEIDKHFLSLSNFEDLDAATLSYIIELYINSGDDEKAFELVKKYNASEVEGKLLLELCTNIIANDGEHADDFLLGLCCRLMRRYLSSEETITYLNRYFIGETEDMLMLWQFAAARNLETRALEERILTQMLFTENLDISSEPVYSAYLAHHPNRKVKDAYATFFSRKYISGARDIPERVFSDILMCARSDIPLNDSMRLALMMYLSKQKDLDDNTFSVLDTLMGEYVLSGVYFPFFKDLDRRLIIKYHLYDKTFVEYQGKAKEHLAVIFSKNEGADEVLDMPEVYPGIYVKVFVLFFGDKLSYQIVDATAHDNIRKEEELTNTRIIEENNASKYERLNAMANAFLYSNEKRLIEEMKDYQRLETATGQLFSML